MGSPIVMPQQKTWGDQIGPLFMSMYLAKFKHNMDMDVLKEETKLQLFKEKRAEDTQKRKEGRAEEIQKRKEVRGEPKIYTLSGENFAFSGGKLTRVHQKEGALITQYKAAVADKSWNPIRTKGNPMSGGIAHYKSYMAKASATPLSEKIALKQTPTPTQEENLDISKKRLKISQQQEIVNRQSKSLHAEQLLLGDPEDPRAPSAVMQFQQNATDQPYMYVTKSWKNLWGSKKNKAEKIDLPTDPEGTQLTAQDIMDTLKANPKKYRNVQDVLKAIGAM